MKHVYTTLGYLAQIQNNATSSALWTANTANAELQITQHRLIKELHDQGYVLKGPSTSGNGLVYENPSTGEQIRIMPKPSRVYRNDPVAKHESEFYYRYRSGPDQKWGPHTSIPDK